MEIETRRREFQQWDQAVRYTGVDETRYHDIVAKMPLVDETVNDIVRNQGVDTSGADSLHYDAFLGLMKAIPEASGLGSPLNRDLAERVKREPDYAALRQACLGDEFASALGACGMAGRILAKIDEETVQANERAREAEKEAQEARAYADALANEPDTTTGDIQSAEKDAAAKRKRADEKAELATVMLRDVGAATQATVKAAIGSVRADVETMQAACNTFGFGNDAAHASVPVEVKFEIANLIQQQGKKFRTLLDVIGRMVAVALRKQSSKIRHTSGEVADVEPGDDIDRAIEEEAAAVFSSNAAMRSESRRRMLDGELACLGLVITEPEGRGPIIMAFDESSSMSSPTSSGNTRESEAKGLALALAHIAVKNKRPFHCLFFQSEVTHRVEILPSDSDKCENGLAVAVRKMAEIARRGTGGGTDFGPVLRECIDLARQTPKADIVFLTDGCARVGDAQKKAMDELREGLGVQCFGFLVGSSDKASASVLESFCNRVWAVDSLLDSNATDVFEMI